MKQQLLVATFVLSTAFGVSAVAQSPGGVAGPVVWLKADAGTTVSGTTLQSWVNQGSSGGAASALGRTLTLNWALPSFQSGKHNFNPAVVDNDANSNNGSLLLQDVFSSAGHRALSSFVLQSHPNVAAQNNMISFTQLKYTSGALEAPYLGYNGAGRPWFFWEGIYQNYPLLPNALARQNDVPSISAFYVPQWVNAATVHKPVMGMNGATTISTNSGTVNASSRPYGDQLFIFGDGNHNNRSGGSISEVITYDRDLTAVEKQKVNSYLAVKYGITMYNDAGTAVTDYLNAAGVVVWSAAANAGFSQNIVGIARENASGLNQKQSRSVNTGEHLLIGTTGLLSDDNADNAVSLTDGQFLLCGDNGLRRAPATPIAGIADVNYRFGAIWKAQNTGAAGTVRVAWPKALKNLTFVKSNSATFATVSFSIPMTAEMTINGVVYNYADVSIADGEFFTFAVKVPAPGGVSAGLTQWYRADEGLNSVGGNGTSVTSWTDFARGTVSAPIGSAPVPLFRQGATNYFNFNPGVNFTAIQQMLGNITTQTLESTSFDIFTLTKEGMTGGTRFFNIGMNNTRFWGDNWDQPGLNYNGGVGTRNSTGGGGGTSNPGNINFSTTIPSIMYHTFTNTSIRKGLNGAALGSAWNISARGQMTGGHIFGANRGYNPPRGDDWGFVGNIGEVIIYGGANLTASERNRVDAYLALKYGITLPAGVNYLNSGGNIVWDATANSAYHNNVAGITNDGESALDQKQSISVNPGQQVIIGTTGLANTNAANSTALSDGQYLVWGDNGLAKVPTIGLTGVSNVNYRFASVWKAQNTAGAGTVRVAWPTGLTNLTLVQSSDPTFGTISSSDAMFMNTIMVNGVAYNYADVALSNGTYFTFAAQLNGPGGVGADLRVWLRSDAGFEPNSWTDLSGNANHYTQTNVGRQPFVATKQFNFNPIIDFGTTGGDARFMVVPSGKPYTANGSNSTIFTAVTHKQASGYSDIIGFGGTTTGSGLTQANDPTFTKLGASVVMYPRTTAPALPAVALNRLYLDDASFTVGIPGIKYAQNGQVTTVAQTIGAGDARHNSGSVLGSQVEERNGAIGEVIAYQRDLPEDQKQRVRTYVAIKYGLTLPHNYIASDGTTLFWDHSDHAGYSNNIAGIARDDHGSLNQRQSWSINTSREVLISTTGLSGQNAGNTTMLADQQALLWGDNGLGKGPTVSITGIPDVNNRFPAIWNVQNTGSVGTVRVAWPAGLANMKLIVSDDDVIDATDYVYSMTNTQVINGVEYAYADLTLADGKFFTFAGFVRAPGGVTNNISYWYRADKFTSSGEEGADVDAWTDFSSGTTIAQLGELAVPKFRKGNEAYFNFNPGVNYTSTAQALGNMNVQTVTSLNFDIYSLVKDGISWGGNGRIFSTLVDNITTTGSNAHWDGIGLTDNRLERVNNARNYRALAGAGSNYSTTTSSIMYNRFTDASFVKAINGTVAATPTPHNAIGQTTGGHAIGSTQISGNGSDNAGFTGNIGELIVYGGGNNTPAERNKIESYLAIKYGITLHNSNNYTTSQDVVVWDAAANSGFYNNVAGIGNDYLSALHQKQSRSQQPNGNDQVTIAMGSVIAATNAENTGSLDDGQFLVWGDNGNTTVMTNTTSTYTTFSYAGSVSNGRRMNRVWKVQNTNNVADEVLIRFPKASVSTVGQPSFGVNESCAGYVIIFADDATFTTNVTVKEVTLSGDNEEYYDATHNFPNGASYFTYGKVIPFGQGAAYLPANVQLTTNYSDDCGIGEWKYFRQTDDLMKRLLGLANFTNAELDQLEVVITPEGASYSDAGRTTRIMSRIATVVNSGTLTSTGKVRVYYDETELDNTTVAGSVTNGWFKYEGSADDAIMDIADDGVFDPGTTTVLVPAATGIENGVRYVEFHDVTSFSSFLYLSSTETGVVLPVGLSYFNASKQDKNVALAWATVKEQNFKGFEIERSADGTNWKAIGFVNSRALGGNSSEQLDYAQLDMKPLSGKNYYRLKQVDHDGTFEYSKVQVVNFNDDNAAIRLFPNPTSGIVNIQGLSGRNAIKVYDISGRFVHSRYTAASQTNVQLDLADLVDGTYYININSEDGRMTTYKIVKK